MIQNSYSNDFIEPSMAISIIGYPVSRIHEQYMVSSDIVPVLAPNIPVQSQKKKRYRSR